MAAYVGGPGGGAEQDGFYSARRGDEAVPAQQRRVRWSVAAGALVPAPRNFYVNLPPLFLGHFSPIFPRFSPFFRRSPHLSPKIQETGTKTRKNGP